MAYCHQQTAKLPKRNKRRQPRLDPQTARIAIIGCGLSGLSTAISLEQGGFLHTHVYERDVYFSSRPDGYGLTLTYNPAGVLAQLGVLNAVADADCPSRSHYLLDWRGRVVGYFGNAFHKARGWGQRGNLRVPRQEVRRILLDKLQHTVVHWGHQLVDIKTPTETTSSSAVELIFQKSNSSSDDGVAELVTVDDADFVVGADGIRSSVVAKWLPSAPPPENMGVRLIVGLTEGFQHELLNERGFYTLASGMRLFVMPYSAPSAIEPDKPLRYMWQLSFAIPDDDDSADTSSAKDGQPAASGSSSLQLSMMEQAVELTREWHEPVPSMIRSTPVESVWGTNLCDRDPAVLQTLLLQKQKEQQQQQSNSSSSSSSTAAVGNIVVVGDALHACSPFKGAGANQSLLDGVTVASWLTRASVDAAVRGSLREMVHRTGRVVQASRQAAQYWHAPDTWRDCQVDATFAGLPPSCSVSALTEALRLQGITATTPDLDARVAAVIQQLSSNNSDNDTNDNTDGGNKQQQDNCDKETAAADSTPENSVDDNDSSIMAMRQEAIVAAASGDRGRLRELSWKHPNVLRQLGPAVVKAVRPEDERTLHWLVTEAGCRRVNGEN